MHGCAFVMPALVAGISFENALLNKMADRSAILKRNPRYLCAAGFADDGAGR
jgi:hypothetical protein